MEDIVTPIAGLDYSTCLWVGGAEKRVDTCEVEERPTLANCPAWRRARFGAYESRDLVISNHVPPQTPVDVHQPGIGLTLV
jgi:hypothetical protein